MQEDGRVARTVLQIQVPVHSSLEMDIANSRQRQSPFIVRLEMPLFLATEDVVKEAFKQIRLFREGFRHYLGHPLTELVQEVKFSREGEAEKRSIIADEISKFREGALSFTQLLREELKRDKYGREILRSYERQLGKRSDQNAEKARAISHRVYLRVRRRLTQRGISPPKPD